MTPKRARHRGKASNTVLTLILFNAVLAATIVTDIRGEPPDYLIGLLGPAFGAFLTALVTDIAKRDAETASTAEHAKTVADRTEARVADVSQTADDATRAADGATQAAEEARTVADHASARVDEITPLIQGAPDENE